MLYCLVSLIVIALVVWFLRRRRRNALKGQIAGGLYFDVSELPAKTYTLEQFVLVWDLGDSGRLTVRHKMDPDKTLWRHLRLRCRSS